MLDDVVVFGGAFDAYLLLRSMSMPIRIKACSHPLNYRDSGVRPCVTTRALKDLALWKNAPRKIERTRRAASPIGFWG